MKLYKKIIFPFLEGLDEYDEFNAVKEYREETVDEEFATEEWEEKMRKKYEKDIVDEEYESIEFAYEYVEISDILKEED